MVLSMISLSGTQLKILSYLIGHPDEFLGIRQLARNINVVYYLTQRSVQQLKKQKILALMPAGRTQLVKLHSQIDKSILIKAENFKRELFYQKYPALKIVLKKIIGQAGSCFFVMMVFGSYVKKPKKDSDLDLLIIVPTQDQLDPMERTVYSIARTSPIKLHETIVTEKSFLSMLQKRELTVANEAKEKHILIYGLDLYYKLVP